MTLSFLVEIPGGEDIVTTSTMSVENSVDEYSIFSKLIEAGKITITSSEDPPHVITLSFLQEEGLNKIEVNSF